MKYFVLIWAGLWRKRARTILTLLSIATAFMLYGTMHGVTAGIDEALATLSDTRIRVNNRANMIDSLPLAHLPQIEALDHVEHVAYYQTFVGFYQEPTNGVAVGAIDLERFLRAYPEVDMPSEALEAMRRTRTGAVIGRDLAESRGWQVGDRIPLGSQVFRKRDGTNEWVFDIVGVYEFREGFEDFAANEMWINYEYFDEETPASQSRVLLYFVGIDDPERAAEVSANIDSLFINSPFPTRSLNERDWIRAQLAQLGDLDFFVAAIIGAVFFTLLFLTGNTMMQSVRERIPELAVLKTYGYGDGTVMALVVAEALLLCLVAAAIGLGIAAVVFPAIYMAMGAGRLPLAPIVFVMGSGFALGLAVISALWPALRARRLTIVDALAGR